MVSLDPNDESHVVAFHEAGHAAAIDRVGLRVGTLWIRRWGDGEWEGECTHAGQPAALSEQAVETNNRVIALAGVAAEIAFAGTANTDECGHDLLHADQCSTFLGDDRAIARAELMARLASAFGDANTREALDQIARLLLERVDLTGELQAVHDILVGRLGEPGPAWP